MERTNYSISTYEGCEIFTNEMIQEIQKMCGEEGYYFEYTESCIEIRETSWDAETDMKEWSKKHPSIAFEILSDIECTKSMLFVKNGKYKYFGEKEEYREELLTSSYNELNEVQCLSWSNTSFYSSNEVNPNPKSIYEMFIVIGKDEMIGIATYNDNKWEAPFDVLYWKYI